MNYITPAKLPVLPIVQHSPLTRSVAPVSDVTREFADANQQNLSTFVYRGELIEPLANDRRYRPQLNLQIDPQNRPAIKTYHKVSVDEVSIGRILDRFI